MQAKQKLKLLAVASAGGHWEQLMLLSAAFENVEPHFASTLEVLDEGYDVELSGVVKDCNKDKPLEFILSVWSALKLVRKIRPNIVLSTGAGPGLITIFWGRLYGAQTIWIDSIANSEKLSLSGRLSLFFAHQTLTQWEHLESKAGAQYRGAVL